MHAEKHLIAAFTGKSELQDSPAALWADLTAKYPAFTMGHYFRAKKQVVEQKDPASSVYKEQGDTYKQTAAKYFNDVRWLDYLLYADFNQKAPTNAVKQTSTQGFSPTSSPSAVAPSTKEKEKALQSTVGTAANLTADSATDSAAEPATSDRLSAVLGAQLADFKKPLPKDARLEVEREPLYKVDYFASQGISIVKPQDGFDKKVRKFTDWLKEMKQQKPENAGVPQLDTSPQEEAQAAKKAAASLQMAPVLTESMAEVLINQGKSAQAREVYEKLSLLYPEKSAYFASKIELLQ